MSVCTNSQLELGGEKRSYKVGRDRMGRYLLLFNRNALFLYIYYFEEISLSELLAKIFQSPPTVYKRLAIWVKFSANDKLKYFSFFFTRK